MNNTKIEWCDSTWNPVTGCTPISEGCANCYARRMATRLRERCGYPEDDPFRVTLHPDRIRVTPYPDRMGGPSSQHPIWRKQPRRIFVCSTGSQ